MSADWYWGSEGPAGPVGPDSLDWVPPTEGVLEPPTEGVLEHIVRESTGGGLRDCNRVLEVGRKRKGGHP